MSPPPMPVPMVMPMAFRAPRAAPTHHSPSTAQLASLSSAAGRPSRSWMIWRSGMLTQPRFGVSSTMPLLVSSGPGAPTPRRGSRRRAPRAGSGRWRARASATSRSTHVRRRRPPRGSARCRGAWSAQPSSATLPDDEVGPADVNAEDESHAAPPPPTTQLTAAAATRLDRQLPHAAVMTQRTHLRPVRGAGAAGEAGVLRRQAPRPRGPKPNAGTVGPKIATTGVPTAVARCSGAESLVTSTARPLDQRRRGPEAERARRAQRAARRRGDDRRRPARASSGPADHHDRARRARPPARRSTASAWCPRSSRAPAPRSPARRPRSREPASAAASVVRR